MQGLAFFRGRNLRAQEADKDHGGNKALPAAAPSPQAKFLF